MARREWVEEVESKSIIPIKSFSKRQEVVRNENVNMIQMDLINTKHVYKLFKKYKPDIVLHLASQPSAPYSQINIGHCNYTQHNNTQMMRNLCWAIKDHSLKSHLVVTTTTGLYGAPDFDIPEGNIKINKMELPYPSMSGSWYHMSRAFDSSNLWLASKQFNYPISEFRTSIVCGSSTKETRVRPAFATRFDDDYYFGVVVNRFVSMAMKKEPITIYGKGLQGKPMISLEDTCDRFGG